MINLAIKTIDRSPKRNYLGETIKNLERSGVFRSTKLGDAWIVDGGTRLLQPFLEDQGVDFSVFKVDSGKRTMHQNAQRCIERAASGPGEYAMVIEDDIDVCDQFLESVENWLEDHALEGRQMYVLGAQYEQIKLASKTGYRFWAYPVGSFYAAQACVWTVKDAAEIAKWLGPDPFYKNDDGEEVRTHGHDLLLQRWGKQMGLTHFVATAPNFVQHIGVESSLNSHTIIFPDWRGREWSYK